MSDISTKLQYLNTTKGKIKDVINMTGANITSDTTFRNYATKLYDGYVNVLKDKNTLLDNMPKGTSTDYITDAANLPVYEDKMSQESTQDGTPTPENPVEVKTVKGYRNLAPSTLYNTQVLSSGAIQNSTNRVSNVEVNGTSSLYLSKGTYTLSIENLDYCAMMTKNSNNEILDNYATSWHKLPFTFTLTQDGYLYYTGRKTNNSNISYSDYIPQLVESTEELPYVPYGTNWIYTTITDGTTTNNYTIPLNGNEIAGIGDYKDELIIDKNGHCWLNKKFPKKIFTENDNWVRQSVYTNNTRYVLNDSNVVAIPGTTILSNYFLKGVGGSDTTNIAINGGNGWLMITIPNTIAPTLVDFKNWLQTKYNEDNPVYALYATDTTQLIDLNYTVDLTLFEGVNNISNSEDMDMEIKYIKDTYE